MMFGSKPWPKDPNGVLPEQTACEGPWAFQPFLIQLQSYAPATAPADPWSKGIIRLQYLSGEELPPGALLKEKNWNPFIYKGKLLFSQVSRVAAMVVCKILRCTGQPAMQEQSLSAAGGFLAQADTFSGALTAPDHLAC
jgi:hypothetical protein